MYTQMYRKNNLNTYALIIYNKKVNETEFG